MFRAIRLFKDQYLGFWILGLLLFAVQELPYMIMPFLKLQENPIMNLKNTYTALDIAEKILGSGCVAMMVFLVQKDQVMFSVSGSREKLFFLSAEFSGLGAVLHRSPKHIRHDVFHRTDAAALLHFHRALAAEYPPCGDRQCFPYNTFCARSP